MESKPPVLERADSAMRGLWTWLLETETPLLEPALPSDLDGRPGARDAYRIFLIAGVLFVIGILALLLGSRVLALLAAFGASLVLVPAAALHERKTRGAHRALWAAMRECEAEAGRLAELRAELGRRAEEVDARSARVEEQYGILCDLSRERTAGSASESGSVPAAASGREQLERELDETREQVRLLENRQERLRSRVRELDSARNRAESELSRLMAESRQRLASEREAIDAAVEERLRIRDEAEIMELRRTGELAAERVLQMARTEARELVERAEEEAERLTSRAKSACESVERQSEIRIEADRKAAEEFVREARARAREVVDRAEEKAARLSAQGEAEFEAVLREIRKQEEIERELRERVAVLNGSKPATPRTGRRTLGSVRRPLAALRRQASRR